MELTCVTTFTLTCVVILLTGQVPGVISVTTLEQGPGNNRTVFEGQRVSLFCDFNDDNQANIRWAHVDAYGVRRFLNTREIDTNYYEIVVDELRQTYELVFNSIRQNPDEGWYECGYENGPQLQYTALAKVYLTVLTKQNSFSCQYWHLPLSTLELHSKPEIDVTCVWNRDVSAKAEFRQNDVALLSDLAFDDRIINRIGLDSNQENLNISCSVTFDLHGTVVSATQPCSNANINTSDRTGVIRVDPFINEVHLGSDAVFTCTADHQSSVFHEYWNVANMTHSFLTGRRRVDYETRITFPNIQEQDEISFVECRAKLSGDIWVSSFAGIKVTTTPHSTSSLSTGVIIAIATIAICLAIVMLKGITVVVTKCRRNEHRAISVSLNDYRSL